MPTEEKVGLAAIRCRGEIFTGVTHADAFMSLCERFPDVCDDELTAKECGGYVTNLRPYVTREEALVIARAAGQVTGTDPEDKKLRSEHLGRM